MDSEGAAVGKSGSTLRKEMQKQKRKQESRRRDEPDPSR
jgi:hypothetical protein